MFSFKDNLKRLGYSGISCEYNKITNLKNGQKLSNNLKDKLKNDLTVIVYNFVDMLFTPGFPSCINLWQYFLTILNIENIKYEE